MMDSVYQIGMYLIEHEGRNLKEVLTEDPKVENVLIIKLHLENDKVKKHSLDIERYDFKKHNLLYPYRKGPSQGPSLVPTAKLTEVEKTLPNKITAWFGRNPSEDGKNSIIHDYLTSNEETIISDISELLESFRREKFILTIDLVPNGRSFWETVTNSLYNSVLEKFARKHETTSSGKGICYHCNEEKDLFGFASPFAFYTHDKVTYAPNFDRSQVWKQYPVCGRCALITEFGAKEIMNSFNFKFYEHSYWIFPNFLTPSSLEEVMDELRHYLTSPKEGSRKVTLRNNLTNDENEILEILSDLEDIMTLTLLFYRKNKSQLEILTVVNDVLPSRLNQLYNAKTKIEKEKTLVEWWNGLPIGKNSEFEFNFQKVRDVFPKSFPNEGGRKDIFGQSFLEITRVAFGKSRVGKTVFLHPAISQIRYLIANRGEKYSGTSLELILYTFIHTATSVLEFYNAIGCLGGSVMKADVEQTIKELKIEKSHLARKVLELTNSSSFFDNDYKKGVFILGILTDMVMSNQYTNLGSKPFFEKLDGLRLNPRKIQKLFPEIMAKLTEYDANRMEASSLEALATRFFLNAKAYPTNEEISFAFAMGLSYAKAIWEGYQKKPEKEENE